MNTLQIKVLQEARDHVRSHLRDGGIIIDVENYSDESSTTWTFIAVTERTQSEVQDLVWEVVGWVEVSEINEEDEEIREVADVIFNIIDGRPIYSADSAIEAVRSVFPNPETDLDASTDLLNKAAKIAIAMTQEW